MRVQTLFDAINATIAAVRNLDITPIDGINRIDNLTAGAEVTEAPRPALGHKPSLPPGVWVAVVAMFFVAGILVGWTARLDTTHDRYLNSHAARMEAETRRYDQISNQNQLRNKGVTP